MAKILIVDDNRFFRQKLVEMFNREAGFQVCGEAENGKDAVEKALKLQPDLIILDFVMPVMNGLDAARVLRLLMPTVPLILASADFDRLAEQEAKVIGIPEILPKSTQMMIAKARQLLYSTHVPAAA
jgi:chemotaxis response regulator CheB